MSDLKGVVLNRCRKTTASTHRKCLTLHNADYDLLCHLTVKKRSKSLNLSKLDFTHYTVCHCLKMCPYRLIGFLLCRHHWVLCMLLVCPKDLQCCKGGLTKKTVAHITANSMDRYEDTTLYRLDMDVGMAHTDDFVQKLSTLENCVYSIPSGSFYFLNTRFKLL